MGKGVASRESSELTESLLSNGELESVLQDRVDVDEKESAVIESAEHIDDSSISASNAARQNSPLEQLDDSFYHYVRWATLDMLLQNVLQRMVLSFFKTTSEEAQPALSDAPLEAEEEKGEEKAVPRRHCCRRPLGRYTPLHRVDELKAVYAIQSGLSFFQKLIFRSLNAFIATILIYRSTRYLSGAQGFEFMEVEQLFFDPEQDGIDTLVRLLADLDSDALLYMLASFPFVLGILRGVLASVTAKGLTEDAQRDFLLYRTVKVSEQSFLRDAIIPLFPRGFSGQMGDVGTSLCWDGRIAPEARQKLLRILQDVAKQGHYVTQIVAMRELSYLAHGGGARDLQTVSAELSEAVLAQRHGALQTLQHLYGQGISSGRYYYPRNLVQHVYAAYLLWWLGLSPSRWLSSGFFLFKAGKLTLQVLLIGKIIQSIDTVLRCRHRSFKFDTGYVYGSDLFSLQCFKKRFELFRSLDKTESVSEWVKTLRQYDLRELTEMDFTYKRLTMDEIPLILDELIAQGVSKKIKKLFIRAEDPSSTETFFYSLADFPNLDDVGLAINSLHPKLLYGLANLKRLHLETGGKEIVLSADMLRDLQQLEILHLDVSAKELPGNLFESLTRLKFLTIMRAGKELPETLFRPLTQLTRLNLYGDCLTTNLPDNLLQKNTLLEEFRLISYSPALPSLLFAFTPKLRDIRMELSSGAQFDLDIFSFMPLLEHLRISEGQCMMAASRVFPSLPRLKKLELQRVVWRGEVLENLFNGLSGLQHLSFTYSQLSALPVKLFQSLRQLEDLDLERNELESVEFIRKLPPMLKELDISNNQIKAFPVNASSYFPESLEEISFEGNPFIPEVITRTFLTNHFPLTIRSITLRASNIDFDALYDLLELKSIYLYGSFSQLPVGLFRNNFNLTLIRLGGSFSQLPAGLFRNNLNLTRIKLSGSFSQLPAELFHNNLNLTEIEIRTENLLFLPNDFFTYQQNLDSLSLYSYVLQSLPLRLFSPLVNLKRLLMDINHGAPLQAAHFTSFKQLERLSISGVKRFPIEGLSQLTQLESILLRDSSVNIWPIEWHTLTSLEYISFFRCGLTDRSLINLANDLPPNLRVLSLENNHITVQGIEALQAVLPCSQLQGINLEGNPGYIEQSRLNSNIQNRLLRDMCEDERCQALSLGESCEQRPDQGILLQGNEFSPNQHHASIGFFGARHNHYRAPALLPNATTYPTSAYVGSIWLLWPTVTMGLLLVFTCLLYLRNRAARQPQKQQIITGKKVVTSGDIEPQNEVTKRLDHENPLREICGSELPTVNHSPPDVVGVRL